MQKKIKISMAAVVALMLAVLAVNLVMGATSAANTLSSDANSLKALEQSDIEDSIIIKPEQAENEELLKQLTPETLEEAERSIYPVRSRFILWTNDGTHVMWGFYGNCRFVGTDNLGKRCWGIYGKGVFAGFYNGDFFWGKYSNGEWNAEYLFGLDSSRGEFVVFPSPGITTDTAP